MMNACQQTIVLTGASGGIGRAIALELASRGARLILVARDEKRLAELVTELQCPAGHAVTVSADLSADEGRQRVVDACANATCGGIYMLINAAGINDFSMLGEQSASSIRQLLDVNLLSPVLLTHELLPLLQQQEESRIINIGSTFGSIGYPGFSSYCASKFGLRGFTEALRRELADTGVRVSYVAPRATRTGLNSDHVVAMNDALGTEMDEPSLVASEVVRVIDARANSDRYIGWPEKLFVRLNALFPALVDLSLRKQLPTIRRFATSKP